MPLSDHAWFPCRFLNDALQVLWPAFDRALGNFLKVELEPMLRASTPAAVDGCSFEALSFGATPIQASSNPSPKIRRQPFALFLMCGLSQF